jgi:hypothetical protein
MQVCTGKHGQNLEIAHHEKNALIAAIQRPPGPSLQIGTNDVTYQVIQDLPPPYRRASPSLASVASLCAWGDGTFTISSRLRLSLLFSDIQKDTVTASGQQSSSNSSSAGRKPVRYLLVNIYQDGSHHL